MSDFAEPRPQRRLERPHRQAHPQRRQHRHRRLGSRARDGLRGAAALQRARHDVPLRLQRRRHRFRRSRRAISIPAETLFIVSSKTFTTLETMTNARAARAWLLQGLDGNSQGSRPALRRRLHQCRRGHEIRHRHREHVRVLGLGRRALLDGLRDRLVDDARHRPGALPRDARRLSRDGRALPHRTLRAKPARADGTARRVVRRISSARRPWPCCRTSSTCTASPLICSSSRWRATAST